MKKSLYAVVAQLVFIATLMFFSCNNGQQKSLNKNNSTQSQNQTGQDASKQDGKNQAGSNQNGTNQGAHLVVGGGLPFNLMERELNAPKKMIAQNLQVA